MESEKKEKQDVTGKKLLVSNFWLNIHVQFNMP